MIRTVRPWLRLAALCALLVGACGDDEKEKGEVDSAVDPATGDDGGAEDAGAMPDPIDQPGLDAGPSDAGNPLPPPPPPADGGAGKPPPGTLIDFPYDGALLSICYDNGDCKAAGLGCYAAFGTVAGFCSPKCEKDDDCAPIGGIKASCSPERLCRVDCSGPKDEGDGACPANMECRDFFDPSVVIAGEESGPGIISIWRCGYPVHAGSNRVELYQQCNLDHGSGDCQGDLLCHAPRSTLGRPENPGYCAEACESKSECTAPAGTTAIPACSADGACELDCAAAGATCPNGMNCRPVGLSSSNVYRCRHIAGKAP